jgi:hypothetical protein
LEAGRGRAFDKKRLPHLAEIARARKRDRRGNWLWDESKISGYGPVAWRVDEEYETDPTTFSVL